MSESKKKYVFTFTHTITLYEDDLEGGREYHVGDDDDMSEYDLASAMAFSEVEEMKAQDFGVKVVEFDDEGNVVPESDESLAQYA